MEAVGALRIAVVSSAVIGPESGPAQAEPPVAIETLLFCNPGNAGEPILFQGAFGAVDYEFAIAKYEVTAARHAAFLNAVAASDPYLLYDASMWMHEPHRD